MLRPLSAAGGRRPLVLLAEDDDELRSLLASVLHRDGHDVVEARTGTELLRRIEVGATAGPGAPRLPDLVVSDVKMPGLSGLEVASALRLAALHIPIVLLTAFGDDEAHERADALGAMMLDKPFDLSVLRAAVRRLLADEDEELATGTG